MNAQWSLREQTSWQRPKPIRARLWSIAGWALSAVVGLAVYTNVLVDDSVVRERATALVRSQVGDSTFIGQVQMRRSVLDYRADYTLAGGRHMSVTCRREAIVVGEHSCWVSSESM